MKEQPFTIEPITAADKKFGKAKQKALLSRVPFRGSKIVRERQQRRAAGEAPARWLSTVPTMTRLENLLSRTKAIGNPANVAAMTEFVAAAKNQLESESALTETRELIAAARGGDNEARVALGVRVVHSVGTLIRSAMLWGQWYEDVTLGEDEVPYLHSHVPQQTNIRVGNSDGTLREHRASPNEQSHEMIPLYFILSDVFTGKIFDPYKGDIRALQLGTVDIAMDLMEHIDAVAQAPIIVGATNSIFTAAFTIDDTADSHFHFSSRIETGNFPGGNVINAAGNGAATLPRLAVLYAIHEYYSRFGAGAFEGADAVPVAVHVASSLAASFGSEFTATSHANAYTDQAFQSPYQLSAYGRTFTIVPDNTISADDKHVYVRPSLPIGMFFQKPAGDKSITRDDEENNEFSVFERKLIGWAYPKTWAPRALAVKFKT